MRLDRLNTLKVAAEIRQESDRKCKKVRNHAFCFFTLSNPPETDRTFDYLCYGSAHGAESNQPEPGMLLAFTSPKRSHVPAESVRTSCRETALMLIAGHSITPFESEPLFNFESAKP